MKHQAGLIRSGATLLAVVLTLTGAPMARGQAFSPYSDFQAMSLNDLATLQVKLSYLGFQLTGVGLLVPHLTA